MKILIDNHMSASDYAGISRYITNLTISLNTTSKRKNLKLYKYSKDKKQIFENGIYRIFLGFWLATLKFKPDILHVSNFMPIIKKGPTVITVHDLCFKTHSNYFSAKSQLAFKFFFARSLRKADAIICVSHNVKKFLTKFYKINQNKIFVIYEASDNCFEYLPNKKEVKNYLLTLFGIDKKFFLVVGLDKRKRVDVIINAFLSLNDSSVCLIIVGGKNDEKILNRYEKQIEAGKIKFLGYVKDNELNFLYNGANALIYNSLCEGFGLPLVEAMKCRLPIICSNLDIFHEIINDAGIFINNRKELVKAMKMVVKDSNFNKNLVEKARVRSNFFSWNKTARQTLKVYDWVLSKKEL